LSQNREAIVSLMEQHKDGITKLELADKTGLSESVVGGIIQQLLRANNLNTSYRIMTYKGRVQSAHYALRE